MQNASTTMVGVGLRHEHYFDAIEDIAPIDFIEVHAENFFSSGGAPRHLLQQARQHYNLSIHATSLGLGSVQPPEEAVVQQLAELCQTYQPFLVSDHACFNRALVHGKHIHTGDLLPIRFNQQSLDILSRHVDTVQHTLQRTLLLENLSAYLPNQAMDMTEFEFLAALSERTGCKLLLDVNNLLVNAHNAVAMGQTQAMEDPAAYVMESLSPVSSDMIGEYHLAGTTAVKPTEIMIDDHARPVSDACWDLYGQVINQFGVRPTLIEWDQELPYWQELVALATKAKRLQLESFA